jgi:hypothetical protein
MIYATAYTGVNTASRRVIATFLSVEEVLTPVYAGASKIAAMDKRPQNKAASFKNAAMGLVYFVGNIVSAALVTVLSLTQDAISIVKDVIFGVAGAFLLPLADVVRGYIGVEATELTDVQQAALKTKRTEKLDALQAKARKELPEFIKNRAEKKFEKVEKGTAPVKPEDNKFLDDKGALIGEKPEKTDVEAFPMYAEAEKYAAEKKAYDDAESKGPEKEKAVTEAQTKI